jgi:hypothetical protein
VGVDLHKSILVKVDPRQRITVSGSSNAQVKPNSSSKVAQSLPLLLDKEVKVENPETEDVGFDDDDNVDDQLWSELAAATNTNPMTGPSTSFVSSRYLDENPSDIKGKKAMAYITKGKRKKVTAKNVTSP